MSIEANKIADKTTDTNIGAPGPAPGEVTRKRRQTPYKPVLATLVKHCMEDSVKDAIEAQQVMQEILDWLDEERTTRESLRARIVELSPLDHRMQQLLQEEIDTLLRIGKLENRIARLAMIITKMERQLSTTLQNSRPALAPPSERALNKDGAPS